MRKLSRSLPGVVLFLPFIQTDCPSKSSLNVHRFDYRAHLPKGAHIRTDAMRMAQKLTAQGG